MLGIIKSSPLVQKQKALTKTLIYIKSLYRKTVSATTSTDATLTETEKHKVYLGVQSLNVRPQILEVGSKGMDVKEGGHDACTEEQTHSQ